MHDTSGKESVCPHYLL